MFLQFLLYKWVFIINNPNITWDFIQSNLDEEWDWEWISTNPNITMDNIKDNPDKEWDWYEITRNSFTKQKTDFMINKYHKHLMAYRIQYRWKNARVNPNCRIGRRKIERDMDFAGL